MNHLCFISGIQNRDSELLKLVEKLRPALTDNEPERRKKGIHVLADVIQHLPQEFLQDTELLVQMNNLPTNVPVKFCKAIFNGIHCQSLQQAERNIIYKIVQVSMQKSTDELKLLGPDFVYGVISMMDGERDPRNLLLLFGMLPHFLRTFPLGHLTEEMFEVVSCYFPIDYYTVYDFYYALLPCLTAVPEFAEFCLPLLIEKLESELVTAKLDSFKALQSCCRTFTIEGMENFLSQLASVFHRELIPGKDKKVCREALAALTQMIHMLSTQPVAKSQAVLLNNVLEQMITDIKPSLEEVQLSNFHPAAQMMLSICRGCSAACQYICTEVVPMLLAQYYKGSSAEGKVVLLQTLTILLAICEEQDATPRNVPELIPLWAEIFALYMDASQHDNTSLRKEGIHGLKILARSLNNESRLLIYDLLCKYVKEEDSAQIRQETVICLKEFSKLYPEEVMEKIVFSNLHFSQGSGDANNLRCMDALCEIAVVEPFTTCIVPQILDFVISVPEISKCSNGIRCLRKLVELPDSGPKMHKYLYVQCAAVSRLVSWWLHGIYEGKHPEIFHDKSHLIDSAKFLSTILRTQTESIQYDVVAEFTSRFLGPGRTFRPLEVSSPWEHTQSSKNKALQHLLSDLILTLKTDIRHTSNAVNLFSWVTKALVMRGHSDMDIWVHTLVELLGHEDIGNRAADGFRLIMIKDEEEYLNTSNFCNIRFLYRQRFFQIVPRLRELYQTANDNVKSNFLVALAFLLQGAPRVTVYSSLSEMVPLLVELLAQTEIVLLLTTLETLDELLQTKQPILEQHVYTFLPRFLLLTRFKESMNVRIKALQCVLRMCTFPTTLLLPFKDETLQELGHCLDDPKRLVRRQAALTRSRWFLLGAPGEPQVS
ncbi:hypothetical protein C0J52_21192 [Blattella germanica]|nr:hypothetical protein C0J52_21192 [Blattella germanica]